MGRCHGVQAAGPWLMTDLNSMAEARLEPMTICAFAVSAPSTYGEVPGGAGRWTLTDVNTGLKDMADMYTRADRMANELTLYTTLQGITMQLLILRLIKVLSAQKRLSILTTTAVKVGSYRAYFNICYFIIYYYTVTV